MGEINIAIWQANEVGQAVKTIIELGYAPRLEKSTGTHIANIDFVAFEEDSEAGCMGL